MRAARAAASTSRSRPRGPAPGAATGTARSTPLLPAFSPSRDGLDGLLRTAGVPVWLPWPLPAGWLVTGFAGAGDERTGTRACAVALSGPNPLGGPAEMLVVAEEPGVGLGAAVAGLDSVDPGSGFASAPPIATASFGKHDFPLWQVASPDRAVFAGEIKAHWLWLVLWPDTAGMLLIEPIGLRDLRDPGQDFDLPFGAPSPRCPAVLMRADLHVHSNASDGTDRPAEVMRRAAAAGLDAVALTDHDTVAGHALARQALPDGLTLVPGMELSCRLDGHSVHLLAYLFDPGQPELAEQTPAIRDDRVRRARAMVARLADLGVAITWEQVAAIAGTAWSAARTSPGRMVASGAITEPGQAFSPDWIGAGGRAYVGRYALDPVRAIRAGPGGAAASRCWPIRARAGTSR